MKKRDIILVTVVMIISLSAFGIVRYLQAQSEVEDGRAIVRYENRDILHIYLENGDYTILDDSKVLEVNEDDHIYIVQGDLGEVIIQYANHRVSVIDETSPQNICQKQGETNSPLYPLTCLPNDVVITIEAGEFDPDDDDIIIQ